VTCSNEYKFKRKGDEDMVTDKRGIELLHDPALNKSTTFTEAEKEALGLVGLVPDVTENEDLQLSRVSSVSAVLFVRLF